MTNLFHLSWTDEPYLSFQYFLICRYASSNEVIINQSPIIPKSTYRLGRYISMPAFLFLQKQKSPGNCIDNPLQFYLIHLTILFGIGQDKVKFFILNDDLTESLTEDIGSVILMIDIFLNRTKIRMFEIGSLPDDIFQHR